MAGRFAHGGGIRSGSLAIREISRHPYRDGAFAQA